MRSLSIEHDDAIEIARETGFKQCVLSLRRTLATTPAGWFLVAWFCWDRVSHTRIGLWLIAFLVVWIVSLGVLQLIIRSGPTTKQHAVFFLAIAVLDGGAWGLVVWLLMGYDPNLDPWLAATLCGVGAVNAPAYITYIRAYYAQIGSLWLVAALALFFSSERVNALNTAAGLTVFFGLIVYYMQAIAQRVLEGIRLQLANTSLAAQLRVALQLVEVDAATDPLTGQINRRGLDAFLKHQLEIAEKQARPFAVLMLDIDHFKEVNDTYGHVVGDDTLRAFAARVRKYLRQGDVCARYGGEEFVVVLPDTLLETAMDVAERLRQGVAESDLLAVPPLRATVSIGAAAYVAGQSAQEILRAADDAVYVAKRNGRNQVQSSGELVPATSLESTEKPASQATAR
jgi:diguanylate cyclase (GGDEF)-like protein